MRNLLHHIVSIPSNLIVLAITGYQKTLSPDHGPLKHLSPHGYCRHSPTCSEYAKKQIAERGAIIGIPKAIIRIASCNPFMAPTKEKIIQVSQGE